MWDGLFYSARPLSIITSCFKFQVFQWKFLEQSKVGRTPLIQFVILLILCECDSVCVYYNLGGLGTNLPPPPAFSRGGEGVTVGGVRKNFSAHGLNLNYIRVS